MRSILVVKLSSVGDVAVATGVVHHLKAATGARITWVIDEGLASLLRNHPDVDELLTYPRDPFRPWAEQIVPFPPAAFRLLGQLRRRRFDLALDLQGRGRTYAVLMAARAVRRIGRGRFPFLTATVPHRRRRVRHCVEALLESLDAIGVERPDDAGVFLPAAAEDRQQAVSLLSTQGVARRYACLVPGSSWPAKRWSPRHWTKVADWLNGKGLDVVLLGSAMESALGPQIREHAAHPERILPCFGVFNLRELVAVAEGAEVLVSADTGPLHVAAATDTPLIALYAPTDPERTGPWQARATVLTAPGCRQCLRPRCSRGCMDGLAAERVISVLDELLG